MALESSPTMTTAIPLSPVLLGKRADPVMTDLPGYSDLRSCAKSCVNGGGSWNIWGYVGCSNFNCVCRADNYEIAGSSLSSCINTECKSNTVDIEAASSIYSAYCASGGVAITTGKGPAGSKTITISYTVRTANGVASTMSIPPIVTVVNQNSPVYNNIVSQGNGNGNGNKSAASSSFRLPSLLTGTVGLGGLLAIIAFL
ncbi:MAG: hypothetical protein M1813_004718 [Trichoglossum hirsutum]|nr:MAG: hypothetical protein M1813_004718 [Trichoglossum hirsutum]